VAREVRREERVCGDFDFVSSFSARASHFWTLLSDCACAFGVPLVVAAAAAVDVALEDWKR